MQRPLKPLAEQVVVVLGGSSGIGRRTANRLARRGASVLVASRGGPTLDAVVREIRAAGGTAEAAVCDVRHPEQVVAVAERAVARFGRIDSWVNVAAVSMFASVEDTTPDEFRRVIEVNYLGQVHGALAALPHLKASGGALIVLSSVESRVALPLHGAYAASKHALEGFTEALRRELLAEGAPVSVTSIKPASVNTPIFAHSRNRMEVEPKGPPQIYHPDVVADCVLYAAEHRVRDLYAGGAGRIMVLAQSLAPALVDAATARFAIALEKTRTPAGDGAGTFDAPSTDGRGEGDLGWQARRTSLYTALQTSGRARAAAGASLLGGLALLLMRRGRAGRA